MVKVGSQNVADKTEEDKEGQGQRDDGLWSSGEAQEASGRARQCGRSASPKDQLQDLVPGLA